jgi:hypothetical protein
MDLGVVFLGSQVLEGVNNHYSTYHDHGDGSRCSMHFFGGFGSDTSIHSSTSTAKGRHPERISSTYSGQHVPMQRGTAKTAKETGQDRTTTSTRREESFECVPDLRDNLALSLQAMDLDKQNTTLRHTDKY